MASYHIALASSTLRTLRAFFCTERLNVAFFDRGERIFFVDSQQHQIRAELWTGTGFAFLAFAFNSALGFVALFLLTGVFLLAFGESGTASG